MSAQDLEQRARQFLAAEWEAMGDQSIAIKLRRGDAGMDYSFVAAIRAIVAALRQQPAPVVDDATVSALQSTRDRMMAALTPKFGDAFDGDFDVMLEAINTLKRLRTSTPPAPVLDDAMRELIEAAEHGRDQLQRALEIDQECTCEPCPQCGRDPNDCSETRCAETCDCTLCDHCCFQGGLDGLTAALARVQGVQS